MDPTLTTVIPITTIGSIGPVASFIPGPKHNTLDSKSKVRSYSRIICQCFNKASKLRLHKLPPNRLFHGPVPFNNGCQDLHFNFFSNTLTGLVAKASSAQVIVFVGLSGGHPCHPARIFIRLIPRSQTQFT